VGSLGHVLEAEGPATVALSLVRGQVERTHPPRALHCEFPLGRPLGRPADPGFQRRVLLAAFSLLERPTGPVLEDFPEVIADEADQPLSCPLPPRFDPTLPAAVDEVAGLRPAYERALATTGRTLVGRCVSADGVSGAVQAFVRVASGEPWDTVGLPGSPSEVALDVRAYYEEAALALADHVPAARAAESWLYRTTATGLVLREAQAKMRAGGAPQPAWFYVVPVSQQQLS
jgi:hypothetical protein